MVFLRTSSGTGLPSTAPETSEKVPVKRSKSCLINSSLVISDESLAATNAVVDNNNNTPFEILLSIRQYRPLFLCRATIPRCQSYFAAALSRSPSQHLASRASLQMRCYQLNLALLTLRLQFTNIGDEFIRC